MAKKAKTCRLSTFRVGLIQNHFFTSLARNLCLQHFIIYNHGPDLCSHSALNYALANSFEALVDAIYLDGGLMKKNKQLTNLWNNLQEYPLKVQYPNSDRHLIEQVLLLKQLTKFEQDIGVEFRHIRIDYLYRYFFEHHEGHLSLLRSCTVSNPIQVIIYDKLGMQVYVDYVREQLRITTSKLIEKSLKAKADVFEALIAALFIDQDLESIYAFYRTTIFPPLRDPNDRNPPLPEYRVLKSQRLSVSVGRSIHDAEMAAAKNASEQHAQMFPLLNYQKSVLVSSNHHRNNSKCRLTTTGNKNENNRQQPFSLRNVKTRGNVSLMIITSAKVTS
ncbi:unnamed protein product [Rotaria sordida]|uniref:RNase III domain-containing protein n=1 Tax=Rotaria sordida TaxID=392033 RepID=A0A814KLK0_9BILA|nr:unnamed protein product [Rotaria sordida]